MGLTWILELVAYLVSQGTDEGDVPEAAVYFLNLANVLQVIIYKHL